MGFEPTIPVFERAKTVHDFEHVATVIGNDTDSIDTHVISFDAVQLVF
jgi:hypothetical protein